MMARQAHLRIYSDGVLKAIRVYGRPLKGGLTRFHVCIEPTESGSSLYL